jgi:hypothetical protein
MEKNKLNLVAKKNETLKYEKCERKHKQIKNGDEDSRNE